MRWARAAVNRVAMERLGAWPAHDPEKTRKETAEVLYSGVKKSEIAVKETEQVKSNLIRHKL